MFLPLLAARSRKKVFAFQVLNSAMRCRSLNRSAIRYFIADVNMGVAKGLFFNVLTVSALQYCANFAYSERE